MAKLFGVFLLAALAATAQDTGASPEAKLRSTAPTSITIVVQIPAVTGKGVQNVNVIVPLAQIEAALDLPGYSDGEVPQGTRNGSNVNFKLAHAPSNYPIIVLNGVVQKRGTDYTITSNRITFINNVIPDAQSTLMAWYRYSLQ